MKSQSLAKPSGCKVDPSEVDYDDGVAPEVSLAVVKEKCIYAHVSVRGKVCQVMRAETLENGSTKQDIIIWGGIVDCVAVGQCYLLCNFTVREYEGKRYLTMCKEGSEIADIGTVVQGVDTGGVLKNTTIVGV